MLRLRMVRAARVWIERSAWLGEVMLAGLLASG